MSGEIVVVLGYVGWIFLISGILLEIVVCVEVIIVICYDLYCYLELVFEEYCISVCVVELLQQWGYEVIIGFGGIGVVGMLQCGQGSCCFGLCVDIDVLLIYEDLGLVYVSQIQGLMYVCGYDGYIVILLFVVYYLVYYGNIDGILQLVFQFVEEMGLGVLKMIVDGLFECFLVDVIYGLYNWLGVLVGYFGFVDGLVMVLVDWVWLKVIGKGGYGVELQGSVDLILVVVYIVIVLQSVVLCNVDSWQMGVVIVGLIYGGQVVNVILDVVELKLIVCVYLLEVCDMLWWWVIEFVEQIVVVFGVCVEIEFLCGFFSVINCLQQIVYICEVVVQGFGVEQIVFEFVLCMVSEDFVFLLQVWLGSFVFVGNGDSVLLYSLCYVFNDVVIVFVVSLWV